MLACAHMFPQAKAQHPVVTVCCSELSQTAQGIHSMQPRHDKTPCLRPMVGMAEASRAESCATTPLQTGLVEVFDSPVECYVMCPGPVPLFDEGLPDLTCVATSASTVSRCVSHGENLLPRAQLLCPCAGRAAAVSTTASMSIRATVEYSAVPVIPFPVDGKNCLLPLAIVFF